MAVQVVHYLQLIQVSTPPPLHEEFPYTNFPTSAASHVAYLPISSGSVLCRGQGIRARVPLLRGLS